MGYTHYWRFSKVVKNIDKSEEKFATAVNLFKKKLKELPKDIRMCNGNGKGKPIITPTDVVFNGSAKNGEDYDTFYIGLDYDESDSKFNFCKTNRLPYDVAVCLALLCFKYAYGIDFRYFSDGERTDEGWALAHQILSKFTPDS